MTLREGDCLDLIGDEGGAREEGVRSLTTKSPRRQEKTPSSLSVFMSWWYWRVFGQRELQAAAHRWQYRRDGSPHLPTKLK